MTKEARKSEGQSPLAMVGPVPYVPCMLRPKSPKYATNLPPTSSQHNLISFWMNYVDREIQDAKDLLIHPFTSARQKKSKFEEFEGQEKASKCSQFAHLARIIQENNLMVKMAKYGRKDTLPLPAALPLSSPVDPIPTKFVLRFILRVTNLCEFVSYVFDLMSLIPVIAMRVIDLELDIVIMVYLVKEFHEMILQMEEIMYPLDVETIKKKQKQMKIEQKRRKRKPLAKQPHLLRMVGQPTIDETRVVLGPSSVSERFDTLVELTSSLLGPLALSLVEVYRFGKYWGEKNGSSSKKTNGFLPEHGKHIELIANRIVEEPLSQITSNTVTLQDVKEQVMTFPIFMDDDDDDENAQEPEVFTLPEEEEVLQEIMERRHDNFPSFEGPPQFTGEAKERERNECLSENKNEFEEDELEKENEKFVESQEDHKEGR
ncbi:hypothetical protein M9H77_02994 [Catharanthus roseus]|uniref:Uncharacterized protein n=1 Tax=Catharanthus roseus TaxID=4058 RepID=A0ACC0CA06_CATRO|nr:hypothetical protein M9H77_02994 [Catharanthus roseus]